MGAEGVQSFYVLMLCPLCFSQPRGPRPRKYCGSVLWTGARQDLTSWRKLGRHYRPSGYQSVGFVPPPWPTTSNNKGGLNPQPIFFYTQKPLWCKLTKYGFFFLRWAFTQCLNSNLLYAVLCLYKDCFDLSGINLTIWARHMTWIWTSWWLFISHEDPAVI